MPRRRTSGHMINYQYQRQAIASTRQPQANHTPNNASSAHQGKDGSRLQDNLQTSDNILLPPANDRQDSNLLQQITGANAVHRSKRQCLSGQHKLDCQPMPTHHSPRGEAPSVPTAVPRQQASDCVNANSAGMATGILVPSPIPLSLAANVHATQPAACKPQASKRKRQQEHARQKSEGEGSADSCNETYFTNSSPARQAGKPAGARGRLALCTSSDSSTDEAMEQISINSFSDADGNVPVDGLRRSRRATRGQLPARLSSTSPEREPRRRGPRTKFPGRMEYLVAAVELRLRLDAFELCKDLNDMSPTVQFLATRLPHSNSSPTPAPNPPVDMEHLTHMDVDSDGSAASLVGDMLEQTAASVILSFVPAGEVTPGPLPHHSLPAWDSRVSQSTSQVARSGTLFAHGCLNSASIPTVCSLPGVFAGSTLQTPAGDSVLSPATQQAAMTGKGPMQGIFISKRKVARNSHTLVPRHALPSVMKGGVSKVSGVKKDNLNEHARDHLCKLMNKAGTAVKGTYSTCVNGSTSTSRN